MSYQVQYTTQAVEDLEKLAMDIRQRIIKKISWLGQNFENIQPIPLAANWAGFYKLRVGDYRVIYEIDNDIRVITIDQVGHRRDIYN
ncbi:type II toxin-antitoxin system RelE/ParE family toxin [Nodosilinea sp. P-1105]|uniref:type II toxin-antitoxin system RelE family toxin n=1 Tax=Nodosilinea sp. P-1105 TaxID=2546229 RepID=UPI00146CBDD2|nr:type II toxin-antitoxin system RelE/ParE family toxin [Nodosilinea sp. P-1105]NMF84792.1 type II toxin-antitoxin system RelE/ParE family toxin [Nodosilinea sp. P-1105]